MLSVIGSVWQFDFGALGLGRGPGVGSGLPASRAGGYGKHFREQVKVLGINEVLTAPRSPWQNPFAEHLIGSIRRECLDHVIVLNRKHLGRILKSYFTYYHQSRTHLSLNKDAPDRRETQGAELGEVVEFPEAGGPHHRYERRAA